MKINEIKNIKNIVPLKYNSFYSVHRKKIQPKYNLKYLPMIQTFSRNFKNEINKIHLTLTKENEASKYRNIKHSSFISNDNKFMNNKRKMSNSNYFRLTDYLRNKYARNIKKINNNLSTPNKVKEIKLNVNKTEYNNFNSKCYRIEAILLEKPKPEMKLIENKLKSRLAEIFNKQKEEYTKLINSKEERKKFLDNYSSIIYYQIYPNRMRKNFILSNNNPNFLNFYAIKNLKKSINKPKQNNPNFLFKENTFFEMIIENVTHKVEYKNQNNEIITIGLVKNLLDEEIDILSNKLKSNMGQNILQNSKDSKINKSTSTNDFQMFKLLNQTYDKISDTTTNSEINFNEKIKKKIENKLDKLNYKYGFMDGLDDIFMNDKQLLNEEKNADNYYLKETEKEMKIKSKGIKKNKKIEKEDDDEDNFGDFVWTMANDINNIDEYKIRKFGNDHDYIFQNTKIRNIFENYLKKNIAKKEKKDEKKIENINMISPIKKTIDFNDFQNNITELYEQLKLKKDLEIKREIKEKKYEKKYEKKSPDKKKKEDKNNNKDINPNKLKTELDNKKKPVRKMRVSTNLNIEDLLSIINNENEFNQIVNGFGGYYTNNEDKKILTKIRDYNPNIQNIHKLFSDITTNMNKEKKIINNKNRRIYKSQIKSILNKTNKSNQDKQNHTNNNDDIINDNSISNNIINKNNNISQNNNTNRNSSNNNNINNIINKNNNIIENNYNNDMNEIKVKENNNKKYKMKHRYKFKEGKYSKNINNENKNIIENEYKYIEQNLNSDKENKNKKFYENFLTDQEKEEILGGKHHRNESKKDIESLIKNDKNTNKKIAELNIGKNKLNMKNIKNNKILNEFEKDFMIKTNFLSDIKEKDKDQFIKYYKELEVESEKNVEFDSSIITKINTIHYLIKKLVISIMYKFNEEDKNEKKEKLGKSAFFDKNKHKEFLKKQAKIVELEDEEEEEQNFIQEYKHGPKGSVFMFNYDPDFEIIFQKDLKRSRSFNIKLLKSYPKIYYNLLAKYQLDKNISIRVNSAKKEILEEEWDAILEKTSVVKRNKQTMKTKKFKKRKKKPNPRTTKSLFIDEYKNIKSVVNENDDEIEQIKDEIKRKKLKKELMEKQLYEFFEKIQLLKKGGKKNLEKEIELLIDEQLEKMDYTREKENESRVNNFIQEFDSNRSKIDFNKKLYSGRMHYISPIIFFSRRKEDSNI